MARGPECTGGKGGLAISHIRGNLEQAHNCTNNSAPPICITSFFDALLMCLQSQANAALPQLYYLALLIGLRKYRGKSETRSANLSINNRAPIQTSRWQWACCCTTSSPASTVGGAVNRASSHLYLILTPTRIDLFEFGIVGRGSWPNKSQHTSLHFMSVFPVTSNPSTEIPSITSISCKVIPISPWSKWNICVFGSHCSTKAVIEAWSTSISRTLNNSIKPATSMYCMIRGSSPSRGNTHLRRRTFTTPGTSYTRMSIVLGSAHELIIKQRCIYNTTTYLVSGAPPKQS